MEYYTAVSRLIPNILQDASNLPPVTEEEQGKNNASKKVHKRKKKMLYEFQEEKDESPSKEIDEPQAIQKLVPDRGILTNFVNKFHFQESSSEDLIEQNEEKEVSLVSKPSEIEQKLKIKDITQFQCQTESSQNSLNYSEDSSVSTSNSTNTSKYIPWLCLFKPVPTSKSIRFLLRRDHKINQNLQYNIYEESQMRHMITVRKEGSSLIMYSRKRTEDQRLLFERVAYIQTNILNSLFSLFNSTNKNEQLLSIKYEANILRLNGPRKIIVNLPKNCSQIDYLQDCFYTPSLQQNYLQFHSLPHPSPTEASIKNFILVSKNNAIHKFIAFQKIAADVFSLQINAPFSAIQGFAIAVSTFERSAIFD